MSLKQKVVKGTIWALLERISAQAVGFIVTLVLARLLTPNDYGTVALLTIFISIAGVLVDSGLGQALIQKKEATELDFNSVFYLSVVVSGIVYWVLFFSAPLIASFYKTQELIPILRVTSITLIFNAINSVQNAELSRKILFNLSFRISLISIVFSAVVGVTCAFLGLGPWALVWQTFTCGVVGVISRWFIIAWRPKLMFSFSALKGLWRFGWKMAASGLLDTFFVNLYGLLIGRIYTRADLAYVQKGGQLPSLIMDNVNGTLGRVAFPALAQMQDEPDRLREAMRKMIKSSLFLVFPLMVGLSICASDTIMLLFGSKWLPAVPYVMIACFSKALWPFHTINLQAITAMGRSDMFLKLEIIKKVLVVLIVLMFYKSGVFWFMLSSAVILGPISVLINSWPNRKLLGYSIGMQLKDVSGTLLISLVMGVIVYNASVLGDLYVKSMMQIHVYLILKLIVLVMVGTVVYGLLAYFFKIEAFNEYMNVFKRLVRKA
jgi:O-antigen/teichoic acid export membrane protein